MRGINYLNFRLYLMYLLPIILLTTGSAFGQKNSYLTYTHSDSNSKFTLQYPNNWKVTEKENGKVLFTPRLNTSKATGENFRLVAFGPTISVNIKRPMYPDQTSIEVCDSFVDFLKNAGYIVHYNEEKVLPNISDKACMVQYDTKGEQKIEAMHGERNSEPGMTVVIRHANLIFFIRYDATVNYYFNKYMPAMEQVIDSFRILDELV